MPDWGKRWCKAYGLCNICLRHPGITPPQIESADKLHKVIKGKPWECKVPGTFAWPPIGPEHAGATLAKLEMKEDELAKQRAAREARHH
jgi:hypothetical protein